MRSYSYGLFYNRCALGGGVVSSEITVTVPVEQLTTHQIAELFMGLDSGQQADFFRSCGEIQHGWSEAAREKRKKGLGGFYVDGMQWLEIEKELEPERYDPHNGYDFVLQMTSFFWKHVFDYAYRSKS